MFIARTFESATSLSPNSSITVSTFTALCFLDTDEGSLRAAENAMFSLTVSVPSNKSSCKINGGHTQRVKYYRMLYFFSHKFCR